MSSASTAAAHVAGRGSDVIEVSRLRLKFYQECHADCRENDDAIYHIRAAIDALEQRRDGRQARGVQGTDKP